MEEVAKAEIIYGSLRSRDLRCPRCHEELTCRACGCRTRYAEKMTDVKIAVQLLKDAVDSLFDRAYLVSRDADLAPAIRAALDRSNKSQIFVLLPPGMSRDEEFANVERDYLGRALCERLSSKQTDEIPR